LIALLVAGAAAALAAVWVVSRRAARREGG
jgi:hypothetical protein